MVALLAVPAAGAADPESGRRTPVRRLAAVIDRHLAADWAARGITPAPGRRRRVRPPGLPRPHRPRPEGGRGPRRSSTTPTADKRAKLVERLLTHARRTRPTSPPSPGPLAAADAHQLPSSPVPGSSSRTGSATSSATTPRPTRSSAAADRPRSPVGQRGRVRFVQAATRTTRTSPRIAGFYQANEAKPENLGAAVSRLFLGREARMRPVPRPPVRPVHEGAVLGVRRVLRRAQPAAADRARASSARCSRRPTRTGSPSRTPTRRWSPRFFDGTDPDWTADRTPRQELADWLTSPKNPYFARNLANRMWAHFFGVGIVDPVDEPGDEQPAEPPGTAGRPRPGVRRRRVRQPVPDPGDHRGRKAYQLDQQDDAPDAGRPAAVRPDEPEGADRRRSCSTASSPRPGYREPAYLRQPAVRVRPAAGQPAEPVPQPLRVQRASRPRRSTTILQALMLMNGQFIGRPDRASDRSEVLAAVVDVPGWDTKQRVEALFLTALARKPTPEELEKFASYVDRGGADRRQEEGAGRRVLGAAEQPRVPVQPLTDDRERGRPASRHRTARRPRPHGHRRLTPSGVLHVRLRRSDRRHLLRVGAVSTAVSMSGWLGRLARGRRRPQPEAEAVVHPPVDERRPGHHRPVGPEARPRERRAVQGDRRPPPRA